MHVRYAERARRDLENIAAYLKPRHPPAATRVGAAIARCIERLGTHPFSGRRLEGPDDLRRAVVPGFDYLVYDRIEADTDLEVLTIRHAAQRRMFGDP